MTEVLESGNQARRDGQLLIDSAPDHWTAARFLAACDAANAIIAEKNLAMASKTFGRILGGLQ